MVQGFHVLLNINILMLTLLTAVVKNNNAFPKLFAHLFAFNSVAPILHPE